MGSIEEAHRRETAHGEDTIGNAVWHGNHGSCQGTVETDGGGGSEDVVVRIGGNKKKHDSE